MLRSRALPAWRIIACSAPIPVTGGTVEIVRDLEAYWLLAPFAPI
jgi:hypothetical protein